MKKKSNQELEFVQSKHVRVKSRFFNQLMLSSKFIILLFGLSLFTQTHAFAAGSPAATITGKITGDNNQPLSGVSIQVKGTTRGTTTNEQGDFSIEATTSDVLVVSYVGYASQEITVGSQTTINVTLTTAGQELAQVVVVGYGTQRRSQIVGSVAKVNGSEITKQPVLTAAQGLQGKAAGVQIIASGQPGSQPQVRIRGVSSIAGDANPIFVVDGVITSDITNINNSDIVSVEVLKDASSQAIYGSRAGNGVVLITTKTGRSGKMRIGFDSYVGFRAVTSKVKLADATTYAQYTNEALAYDNQAPLFNLDTLKYNTDWFDAITHKGMIQNYSLNVSGGSDNVIYYFGASYFKDNGTIKGQSYDRGVIRSNNEYRLTKFLKLGHNVNVSFYKANGKPNEFGDAYRMAPTAPIKFPNGNYGYFSALSVANPVAALYYANQIGNGVRLQGNAYAEITPLKGLVLRSSLNFDKMYDDSTDYAPEYTVFDVQRRSVSKLLVNNYNRFYYIFDNNATYKNIFAQQHEINVTVGYSAERDRTNNLQGTVNDVPNQRNLWYIGQGDLTTATSASDGSLIRRASLYSRVTYTFDKKYNVSASLRRDGSSSFPTDNQYGTFYSVGASWIVSEENFMKNQKIFNDLKLRGGYGKVGLDVSNLSLATLNGVTIQNYYYPFGGNSYPAQQAITFDQLKNAAASWETTKGIDAGIEFTMLDRKLSGEIAYYNKLSNPYINVTVPSTVGDVDQTVFAQAADVRNKGFEFSLRWADKIGKDFRYYIGGNMTFNTNNVEHVDGSLQLKAGSLGNGEITTYTVEGQPIGSFWVLNVEGIYKTQDEIDKTAHIQGTKPGDFQYQDVNGDGNIDDKDRIFAGSYQPKTYYGINGGINWKQLDFSFDCYGNAGNKVYNGKKGVRFGNENIEASRAENRWSASNPNGTQPRASNAIPRPSTYFVESGSFFRINNLTLGYTIPTKSWNAGITSLRFFATAQNPVIFKKYSGYTPELPGGATSAGIELNIYPVSSTYMMGVNLSF